MIPTQKIAAEILLIVEQEGVSAKEVLNKLTKGYDYKVRGSIHAYVFE
ncbi:MAG: RNA methyltransferase, partial [Thaumarchaeota archaeon]